MSSSNSNSNYAYVVAQPGQSLAWFANPLAALLGLDGPQIPDTSLEQTEHEGDLSVYLHDGKPVKAVDMTGFDEFDAGHRDLVTSCKFNFHGDRIVTASSDHRVKVWDLKDGQWVLVDTWRGHDAEIRDAKWNGPFTGQHIGTVGEDLKLKIWEEDVTQAPNSGRRFKCIWRHPSPVHTPYVCLDFKNIEMDTWLAVITRDGLLSVLEPTNNTFNEWQVIDQFRVCETPARGEETSFKVQFHEEPVDLAHTLIPGSIKDKSLELVVAAMDTAKIYRTDANYKFYQAAELTGHPALVRDIAWANGCVRGFDIIASGCKDGNVRIFELRTALANANQSSTTAAVSVTSPAPPRGSVSSQSAITTGLTGDMSRLDLAERDTSTARQFRHTIKEVANFNSKHRDVWQVEFSKAGDCLISTGDDGIIRFWKMAISGEWVEFADTEVEYGDEEEANDGTTGTDE